MTTSETGCQKHHLNTDKADIIVTDSQHITWQILPSLGLSKQKVQQESQIAFGLKLSLTDSILTPNCHLNIGMVYQLQTITKFEFNVHFIITDATIHAFLFTLSLSTALTNLLD